MSGGAFLDIGGASTEIVTFEDGKPVDFASFPIGSLSLYRRCVKKILPGEGSLKRLRQEISDTLDAREDALTPSALLVGVGGTARAALKLARFYHGIADDCRKNGAELFDSQDYFMQQSPHSSAQPSREVPRFLRRLRDWMKTSPHT